MNENLSLYKPSHLLMTQPASHHKNRHKAIFITIGITFIAAFSALYFIHKRNNIQPKSVSKNYSDCDRIHYPSAPIQPTEKLNDLNDIQLIHAQKNGLKIPFRTNEEFNQQIHKLIRQSVLLPVVDNRYYQIKSLTHSQPYLIPEAIDMLNEIGYRFQERLKEKKYTNFKFRLTSLLRTGEAQSTLSRRNGNATKSQSCHIYGTTVDISYKNFINTKNDTIEPSYEAVISLTKVLSDMRKECKILAVRERHQSCFHITVVCCDPNYKRHVTPDKQ